MIKMSILWDEKSLKDLSADQILIEMKHIYDEYQQEIASVSDPGCHSLSFGLFTDDDAVLLKKFLNLPAELRNQLLEYIQTNLKTAKSENLSSTQPLELKNLLLNSPHKDLEIHFDRQTDKGRDIMI